MKKFLWGETTLDITSPITLWKDYDVSALPINASPLSEKQENGKTVKPYYFDGFTTIDGRVRAFINLLEHPDAKGVVLYLPDAEISPKDPVAEALYSYGYTVAELDYLGKTDNAPRYTLYPRSLSGCNKNGTTLFEVGETEQLSNWYIWTCIARRAIKFLKNKYDLPIFALGVGLGGTTAYKLSAFDDGLTSCATLLNIIPNVQGQGNQMINYRASLDNGAYATLGKIPVYMAISSNAVDGSLDEMAELALSTASLKRFRIIERAFADGVNSVYPEVADFFAATAGAAPLLPKVEVNASNSEGNLYFNININREENDGRKFKAELFVSFCIEESQYRNWMSIPIISLSSDKYMAKANVCNDIKPVFAFANITDESGNTQSSNLLGIIPKHLGIKARAGVSHRKIYDGSMGKDGWTARLGGEVKQVKGPFDIEGVTSTTNSLITFKPGDPLFKVSPDIILQIMLCGAPQKVSIIVREKKNAYSCQVEIPDSDNWHKFSLSHMNFKGANGMLLNWSNVSMFEITSKESFTVGSLLWV